MLELIMASLFGVAMILGIILASLWFISKHHRIFFALLPLLFVLPFTFQAFDIGNNPPPQPFPLFASMAAGFLGYLGYWPKMLQQLTDHTGQWASLISVLILVVINQLLWGSLVVFCLPAFTLALFVIGESLLQDFQIRKENQALGKQLESKTLAVGLDIATGLPNRLAFSERIDKWLVINPEQPLNVIVFKLTQFQLLNSLIGHHNADLVKVQLISRLKKCLHDQPELVLLSDSLDTAFLATLGGVDFTLALHDDGKHFATEKLLSKLTEAVKEPLVVNATAVDVGVDFGVSTYPEQGLTATDLIEHAFMALNENRKTGKSHYYNDKLHKRMQSNRAVISQLRDDLSANKFELYVQPQVNLTNNQVEGGEVLIRWRRDEAGVLDASKFIELAEESGVIYQLSLWSLEVTISKLAEMQKQGLNQYLAVNISNKELFHSQLVESMSQLINQYGIRPDSLVVEIKESAFAINQQKALKTSRLIEQLGVKVALDEFGKDQSAISSFNRFTPFYVKVDCRNLNVTSKAERTNTFLNAIIGLAHTLKIRTIAHGIELDSTLSQLRDIECDVGQGYLFSKPFELSGFDIWLEQWRRQHGSAPVSQSNTAEEDADSTNLSD